MGCRGVLAVSTNDGLGASGENIARLFQRKHYYFVPYGQDAPAAKPQSLKADFARLPAALAAALQDPGALRAQVVSAAESILSCVASVPLVTSADAIVLAADCTCSHYTAVNDQNEQIQRLGKNILGCIVFE